MKTDLKLKAKYYSQYWGQNVISDTANSGNRYLYPVEPSNMYRFEESYLQLRDISSLTDEEMAAVAKFESSDVDTVAMRRIGKTIEANGWITMSTIEYLRSISIALPCFNPETNELIPVADLVDWGWIILEKGM